MFPKVKCLFKGLFQGFALLPECIFFLGGRVTSYLKASKQKSSVIKINLNSTYSSPLKSTRTNSNNLEHDMFN